MRSPLVLAIAAVVLLAGCGDAAGRGVAAASPAGGAPHPAATTNSTPTATPTFNLDDMMGFYAQQTVFVADSERVSAVTLLNHFTRYAILTHGKAQVAADTASSPTAWLYVLDGFEATAARIEGATVRLRAFDVATGIERASRTDIGPVSWVRSMATVGDGRVLVLKSDAGHAWIDAYERATLKPLGTVMEKPGCGDRLLASQARLAIVCLATGEMAVDALRGAGTELIAGTMPGLAGVAMAPDGTIWAATAERDFAAVPADATNARRRQWPAAWSGTVLPDGIALTGGVDSLVIAQTDTDGSWLRVLATNVVAPRESLRLAGRTGGAPQFGILALYPFAYFAAGGSVRHVEIQSGMLETMTELGQGATIVAVVDR